MPNNADVFKRRKAKVGKRALKPANETDTSFQVASVGVRAQTAIDGSTQKTDSSELMSSRGRSLRDLASKLHHPATAVRLSAAKGLKDLLDTTAAQQQSTTPLAAHFSLLFPTVGRCLLDSVVEIRELALQMLKIVVESGDTRVLRPFVSLWTAFVASALNNLDRGTQKHGVLALELTCRALPTYITMDTFLPALVRLMGDRYFQRTSDKKQSGRSQYAILLSGLLTLLESTEYNVLDETKHVEDDVATLTFVSGGRSANALLMEHRPTKKRNILQSITSLNDVFGKTAVATGPAVEGGGGQVAMLTALLVRIRDFLVELTENNLDRLSSADMDCLFMLSRALRITTSLLREATPTASGAAAKSPLQHLATLMISKFPLTRSENTDSRVSAINVELGLALCSAVHLLPNKDRTRCTQCLAKYTSSTLDVVSSEFVGEGALSSKSVIAVMEWMQLGTTNCLVSRNVQDTLLKKLKKMCLEEAVVSMEQIRSKLFRSAVLLCCEMASLRTSSPEQSTIGGDFEEATMKGIFPYLRAWRDTCLAEATIAIETLHGFVRASNPSGDSFPTYLRAPMEDVFAGNRNSPSLFEIYPVPLQRTLVATVVLLQKPTASTLSGLGRICARGSRQDSEHAISVSTTTFIVESIHSIRMTISLQVYLGFLVESTGAVGGNKKDASPPHSGILKVFCQCVQSCGIRKIVPMLVRFLCTLLIVDASRPNSLSRAQSCMGMLAVFSSDAKRLGMKSIFELLDETIELAVMRALFALLGTEMSTAKESLRPYGANPNSAVVVLLQVEPQLLVSLMERLSGAVVDQEEDVRRITLRNVLVLLRHLSRSLKDQASELHAHATKLLETLQGTSSEADASSIVGEISIHATVVVP